MASAKRQPGSDLGRAAIDWDRAFAVYAALSPEQRSYQAIADRYGISLRTVETHGRRERWRERAEQIDREAAAEAERRIGRARADQLADVQRLIEASFIAYAQQLRNGDVRLTASDLPRLVKLLTDLWTDPAETYGPVIATPIFELHAAPAQPSLEHMTEVLAALQETISPVEGPDADDDHEEEVE